MSNNNQNEKTTEDQKKDDHSSNQKQGHTLTPEDRSKGGQHSHDNDNKQGNQEK